MKNIGNIARLIGQIVKYLPVILMAFKALEEVKEQIEQINASKDA